MRSNGGRSSRAAPLFHNIPQAAPLSIMDGWRQQPYNNTDFDILMSGEGARYTAVINLCWRDADLAHALAPQVCSIGHDCTR